ncbi:MAG: TatD family hydrolase [Fibrella sp.]|nr:TatD family hydrolase [Armatimonadota bacterium]
MVIDTHVHFNGKDLGSRDVLPGVLERAKFAGVERFIIVGYDLASSERAVTLAESDSRMWATVGIHPHDAANYSPETETRLRELATHPRTVAIGEIGLDFYRDLSPRDAQDTAFRAQIVLARETCLPIVIHCRDAYPETLAILESEAQDIGVILHCFAGDAGDAERAFRHGWYLGIGGTVTYKKNDELRAIVQSAPQNLILLETDAPYLSPEPFRGKFPNEPARVSLVAQRIAEIRSETKDAVITYTTENALRGFSRVGVNC